MISTTTSNLQSELLTQVDAFNQIIGPISRGEAHQNHTYYRTVYILVKNSRNQILIQKRSPTKDLYPNCWDLSVGGHVAYGFSYLKSAIQELQEELNLTAKTQDLKFIKAVLVHLPQSHEFFHVFDYHLKPTDTIILNHQEIQKTQWLNLKQIIHSINDHTLSWYPRPIQVIKSLIS